MVSSELAGETGSFSGHDEQCARGSLLFSGLSSERLSRFASASSMCECLEDSLLPGIGVARDDPRRKTSATPTTPLKSRPGTDSFMELVATRSTLLFNDGEGYRRDVSDFVGGSKHRESIRSFLWISFIASSLPLATQGLHQKLLQGT